MNMRTRYVQTRLERGYLRTYIRTSIIYLVLVVFTVVVEYGAHGGHMGHTPERGREFEGVHAAHAGA